MREPIDGTVSPRLIEHAVLFKFGAARRGGRRTRALRGLRGVRERRGHVPPPRRGHASTPFKAKAVRCFIKRENGP